MATLLEGSHSVLAGFPGNTGTGREEPELEYCERSAVRLRAPIEGTRGLGVKAPLAGPGASQPSAAVLGHVPRGLSVSPQKLPCDAAALGRALKARMGDEDARPGAWMIHIWDRISVTSLQDRVRKNALSDIVSSWLKRRSCD